MNEALGSFPSTAKTRSSLLVSLFFFHSRLFWYLLVSGLYAVHFHSLIFFLLWSLFDLLSRKLGFCLSASPGFLTSKQTLHILPSQSQPVQCLCYHKHVNVIYTEPRGNISFLAACLFFLNLMIIFLFSLLLSDASLPHSMLHTHCLIFFSGCLHGICFIFLKTWGLGIVAV